MPAMTNETLDVLVIESHEGAAATVSEELERGGAAIQTCHRPGEGAFPCVGLVNPEACPLARSIDVALVVRDPLAAAPTTREDGVRCAIRAGIPLLEVNDGPADPYGLWLTAHATPGQLVADVHEGIDRGFDPLRREIGKRIAPTLARASIEPESITIDISASRGKLNVTLGGHAVPHRIAQQLAVRVFDATRSAGRSFSQVAVSVSETSTVVYERATDRTARP